MRHVNKILFLTILLLFVIVGIRRVFTFSSSETLKGIYETASRPSFSCSSWFDGSFREQFSRYIDDLPGLRGTFIRIRNQYDFSLFSIPHANNVVVGKQNCLFGIDNINSYQGSDFAGAHYLDVKTSELKSLQDALWNRKKILLLVIFAPDKATFFHELIPDRLIKKRQQQSNYLYYSKKCVESGVNLIDFNRYFLLMKDTIRYPLYAKTGAHWSYYGAILAADSMIRYIEKKLDIKLNRMNVYQLEKSRKPRNYDGDISSSMNLFREISQPELAYPLISFKQDSDAIRPSALFIGDSYYWIWHESTIIKNLFSNDEFWYYDANIYPETFTKLKYTWETDLVQAIDRQKIIILMQTSKDAECELGFGFVDRTWPEFDSSTNNRIRNIEKVITKAPENMKMYEQKARDLHAPLKTIIRTDAIFAGNKLLREKK